MSGPFLFFETVGMCRFEFLLCVFSRTCAVGASVVATWVIV